jgi:hypothetical protein
MSRPYPVIEQRALDPVPGRRLFGRRPRRAVTEIPQGHANHRLVYSIEGAYVLDDSTMRPDSPEVLAASHVSVVDVSPGAEVVVQLDIPSKDADVFTLRATFVCGVMDPITLVREGPHDMESALRGYLKSHHRIFELGLDYRLTEINDVRRKLNAQVRAYTTIQPPAFLGLTAQLASVEVLTPEELAKFNQSLREQEQKYAINFRQQESQHLLDSDKTMYERHVEIGSQRHELDLDANRRQYQRYQHREQLDAVATDPRSALTFAYTAGDISAKEYADQMVRLDQVDVETAHAEAMRNREDAREIRLWDREDAHERREWERNVDRRVWEAQREDKAEDWRYKNRELDVQWEDRKRLQQWTREDQAFDREDKRRHLEANIEIIKELAQRGHLDTVNVNLEQVVNRILDEHRTPIDGNPTSTELAPAQTKQPADDDRRDDAEVREEDAD